MLRYRRSILITAAIVFSVVLMTECVNKTEPKESSTEKKEVVAFAGSASCKNCHQDIYNTHLHTAHYLTSQIANSNSVKGSFDQGKNAFKFNSNVTIVAEKKGDSLFQTAYQNGIPKVSRPFNFTIGSGKRGQTFLYWYQNYLFQLPLTYFSSTNEWTNSPGYINKAQFNRPITIRCMECHSTYFKDITAPNAQADQFSNTGYMLGVDCEKCHGPGSRHVAFETKNPGAHQAGLIINPSKFTRQQSLDLCRLCHGGKLAKTVPSFSFTSGDKLADYFALDSIQKDVSAMDVHGNQFGMLSSSKCFKQSEMNCMTCHNPHKNEAQHLEGYNQKCLSCHYTPTAIKCGLDNKENKAFLQTNCVGCHMPEFPSRAIVVLRQGETVPTSAYMRAHYIAIYKEESDKILKDRLHTKASPIATKHTAP